MFISLYLTTEAHRAQFTRTGIDVGNPTTCDIDAVALSETARGILFDSFDGYGKSRMPMLRTIRNSESWQAPLYPQNSADWEIVLAAYEVDRIDPDGEDDEALTEFDRSIVITGITMRNLADLAGLYILVNNDPNCRDVVANEYEELHEQVMDRLQPLISIISKTGLLD